jgi:hypothetical protein
MADQVGSGIVEGAMSGPIEHGSSHALALAEAHPWKHEAFHGRPVSWVAVSIIVVGFIVGGAALVAGPFWWLVWVGGGIALLGGIVGLATGIFHDWY